MTIPIITVILLIVRIAVWGNILFDIASVVETIEQRQSIAVTIHQYCHASVLASDRLTTASALHFLDPPMMQGIIEDEVHQPFKVRPDEHISTTDISLEILHEVYNNV